MIHRLECQEIGTSDPLTSAASEAVTRQCKKNPIPLIPFARKIREGVHTLPRWDGYSISAIFQGEGAQRYPRGTSLHGVVFATAELRTPGGQIEKIDVAIKPFTDPRKAVYEASVNSVVLDRGLPTTNPCAVLVGAQDKAFIVTPARPNVQTIDTEPWHQFSSGSQQIRDHFLSRLRGVGSTLAEVHLSAIQQGDVQLRNFWVTPEGQVEAFDWESSRVFPTPLEAEHLLVVSRDDLLRFYKNLRHRTDILFGPLTSRFSQFREYVFDPYYDRLETLALEKELPDEVLSAVSTIRQTFSEN